MSGPEYEYDHLVLHYQDAIAAHLNGFAAEGWRVLSAHFTDADQTRAPVWEFILERRSLAAQQPESGEVAE